MRVLMITSEWPTRELPYSGIFVERQAASLRALGVEVDVLHFRGAKKVLNYINAWRQAKRQLSTTSYDLIHAHWGQSAMLAMPKKLPLVITYHGGDLEGTVGQGLKNAIYRRVLGGISKVMSRLADEVIVVSGRTAIYMPQRPYHLIPCGLDTEIFRPMPQMDSRQRLNLPLDKRLILFAASPARPEKRFGLAEESVSRLKADFDVDIVVCDDVQPNMMPYYMNACDALLLTSSREGSPTVIKEALACNTPIVSTDVGDVKERLKSIEGCVLCTDDRPENIAAGLAQVLSKNRRLDSRKTVVDLDEKVLTKRVISVYEQAVSRV